MGIRMAYSQACIGMNVNEIRLGSTGKPDCCAALLAITLFGVRKGARKNLCE